ncbi:Z-ring formation inhibitor MciZ [Paenibacillus senegalensis]|uniref:Z-ring formation inhibitor MciZ n=1 Tax=Paenibacillus senegalensis TaxID=1465766 RepID=UPI0002890277|nr:Z-ring formation inhibitor MciZ [Paenibacillus senegalensis]
MKAYRTKGQLKLVGKAWEVRTYLQREVKHNQQGNITLNDWLSPSSPINGQARSLSSRFKS